jgi:hypothetical protein
VFIVTLDWPAIRVLGMPRAWLTRCLPPLTLFLLPQIISFDQDGVFEGREVGVAKPPVRLLQRIEELRVLSQVSEAGLLSSAEDAGLFSKLEAAGAFSKAEALLPLADDLKLLSTAEALLNVPSSYLFGIASLLLVGGAFRHVLLLACGLGGRGERGEGRGWKARARDNTAEAAAEVAAAARGAQQSVRARGGYLAVS